MANFILVKVDTNDGDYVTAFKSVSDEHLETIKPLIEKITANPERHNFPYIDYDQDAVYELYAELTELGSVVEYDAAIDTFLDYCPDTINGFHTVRQIELYDVGHIESLLK
jgi:hypothetical protein